MTSVIPSASGLWIALREKGVDIIELLLFGAAMFALGLWMGIEFAWRASFAIDKAVLGGVPNVALSSAFLLLILMGIVGMLFEK